MFQKWQEFVKSWPGHSKVLKICTLIGSYCVKYLIFDLKKYRGVIFHDNEDWRQIIRKNDLWFWKWHEDFVKFSPEHSKVSKLKLWWDPFVQSRKCMSLKFTGVLCVMKMKMIQKLNRNWLIILKLTWGIWQILTWALKVFKNFHFRWAPSDQSM